jgi:hypothetical protein
VQRKSEVGGERGKISKVIEKDGACLVSATLCFSLFALTRTSFHQLKASRKAKIETKWHQAKIREQGFLLSFVLIFRLLDDGGDVVVVGKSIAKEIVCTEPK